MSLHSIRQQKHCVDYDAGIIRQAIELYIEDFDDLFISIDRLRDPSDETVDWQEARRALLAED